MVILGCFYQRQDQVLADEAAVRAGVVHVAQWIQRRGFRNVVLEIANEFDHDGFDHPLLRSEDGEVELIRLAKKTAPGLLVSTSGLGHGRFPDKLAKAADFLLIHFNGTPLDEIPSRIAALKKYGKPIVCNEDQRVGEPAARAAELCVAQGASWGLMEEKINQHFPFAFQGAKDDPVVYAKLKELTSPRPKPASTTAREYFPPPESKGGWRKLDDPDSIRRLAGMDPDKLTKLRAWLRQSDDRDFAAVVIRRGYIVLEEERGNSAVTDSRRVASCSKAVCATVLAIASEQSQQGHLPRKMTFDDHAFDFIPWAQPLSDPRKAQDHREATAESHLGDLSRSDRRAQRWVVGIHPGPHRRRADRRSWRSIQGPPAATPPTRWPTRRWSARRSRASRTISSPSKPCSSRWGSSTGGFSSTTAGRSTAVIRRTGWACPRATWPGSPTAWPTTAAGTTRR